MRQLSCWLLVGVLWSSHALAVEVGFGEQDISPDYKQRAVWIAGYGNNRRATDLHDPIMARAIVLKDGSEKIALASVDLVGLQYTETKKIRAALAGYRYVLVASTHNHEGPDVIGLWGPSEWISGVDPQYLDQVVARTVKAIEQAEKNLSPAIAVYGTAEDQAGLLRDSRLPQVVDPVMRVLKFVRVGSNETLGLLVNWNCHPEAVGSKNQALTADFPATTVAGAAPLVGVNVNVDPFTVAAVSGPPFVIELADLPAGEYTLHCRTVDDKGLAQPLPRPFQKSGHAAIENIALRVGT